MGNVTKKDIIGMVGLIKANYNYAYKDVVMEDMEMLYEMWFRSLAKYDKKVVGAAFQRAMETCKMPPTLADIMQHLKTIKAATEPTDTELWEKLTAVLYEVDKCVYAFRYTAIDYNGLTQGQNARNRVSEIWDNLPPILKEYCGDKGGLINLSKLDMEELGFEKGRFLKLLPTLRNRMEIRQTINPDILQLVGGGYKELGEGTEFLTLKDTKN